MRIIYIAFALIFVNTLVVCAQRCQAEEEFDGVYCQSGAGTCVLMTVNTDPGGREFIYRWNCGDGKTELGASAEHCYDHNGVYNVSLDLIDKKTGDVVKREVEKTIVLNAEPVISVPSRVYASEEVKLTYNYDAPTGFKITGIYWSYGDGAFSCSSRGIHTYRSEGQHAIKLLIVGMIKGEVVKICSEVQVNVLPGNINSPLILDAFEKKEKAGIGGKRFLEDDAYLALLDSSGLNVNVVVVKRAGSHLPLEPNKEYAVTACKGNLFLPAIKFRAGLPGVEDESLSTAIAKMAAQPVDSLPAVKFVQDKTDVGLTNVRPISKFIQSNQASRINIGVYTHTGGRLDRNVNLSLKRAEAIRDLLIQQGVPTGRIRLFTAKEDGRLLNSCQGLINCTIEEDVYNRKAEFRISYLPDSKQ